MTYEDIEPFDPLSKHLSSPQPPESEEHARNGIEFLPPADDPEVLRVLAVGARPIVNRFVHRLHQHNIAHYSEWTRLIPTPNPGEFMRMLTKRIPLNPDDRENL